MDRVELAISDLCVHVAKIGLDVYPPVEIANERTRLNMFYEEARHRWPDLFDRLLSSDTDFRISRGFRQDPNVHGPLTTVDTFVLVPRGPVFIFPLLLPDPVGSTNLEEDYFRIFEEVRDLFLSALPGREILRLGLVRELLFKTETTNFRNVLGDTSTFSGAELIDGSLLLRYRDSKCNIRIQINPVEISTTTQLPIGRRVERHEGYGLQVHFDVNNHEIRPLGSSDIAEILERANGFWPDELLKYINERSSS